MNNVLNIKLIEQLTAISDAESIHALCKQIYQIFDAELDSLDSFVFYQAEDTVYRPIVYYPSDANEESFLEIAQADVPTPLKNNQPNINKDKVYLGIHAQGQLLGILCFQIKSADEQDQIHWVLVQNLLTLQFKDLLILDTQADSPQSKTLQEITVDKTFDEMALSIARHMLPQKGRYVTINKLFYDEQGQVIEWGVVASANRNKIMTDQITTTFPWKSLLENTKKHILSGQILHVTKEIVADDTLLSGKMRDFFNQANVQSIHNLPIMADGQVIAVLTVVNRNEQSLTPEDEQAFKAICNQIGTVIFLRDQLNQTTAIQESLRTMVDAAYQISLAENDAEIIKTLFTSMPEEVSHIALYRFPTPITKETHPTSLTLRALANSNEVLASDETLSFEDSTFSKDLLQTLLAGQFVIESDIHATTDRLPSILYGTVDSSPIQAFILTGLRSNDQLMGLILIGTDKNISIDIGYHRNFRILADQIGITYDNQQLLQSAQITSTQLAQQVQIQRSLNELATFTGRVQDEKLLLEKGAETLQKIMKVDHVGIMLLEDDSQQAYLSSEYPKRSLGEIRIRMSDDILDTLTRGENYIMKDATSDSEHIDSATAVQSVDAKSSIFLPFRDLSGKLMGSVGLDQDSSGITLSEEQLQTAQLINAQIVSQLQNLRLLQDSQTLATQMQQVARFGETVQARLDLEEILQTSLHFIQRIFEADYIAITLYDETIEELIVQAYYLEGNEVILPTDNVVMPSDNTPAGVVWKNRSPLYISNLQDSEYSNPLSSTIRAVHAVALTSRSVTLGVIELGRTYNRDIRSVEQSVLLQLANQLAVALENTNTYVQSQRLAQNKVLANEISLQLQQQVDIDSLLNTTVTELGKALGAKRARIRLGIQQVVEKE